MVRAYIARIKQVNAVVNAVTEELYEQAMREADAADRLLDAAHTVRGISWDESITTFSSRFILLATPLRTVVIRGQKK